MSLEERIFLIERRFGYIISDLEVIENYDEYFKIKIVFKDGSVLRITEAWSKESLFAYSYYWLTNTNKLIIGWDNAPHHKKIITFPHHKHLENKNSIQASKEKSLEDVLKIIEKQLKSSH